MKHLLTAALLIFASLGLAEEPKRIAIIDSITPTEPLLAKPGTYLGEKFTYADQHTGNVPVRVGVWESGAGVSELQNFPFTEYVLMISGHVIVTELDGTSHSFKAGDTFVIPKGWSGTCLLYTSPSPRDS